jgi:hypothetical protein
MSARLSRVVWTRNPANSQGHRSTVAAVLGILLGRHMMAEALITY